MDQMVRNDIACAYQSFELLFGTHKFHLIAFLRILIAYLRKYAAYLGCCKIERLRVQASQEALHCVLEQDTLSSA